MAAWRAAQAGVDGGEMAFRRDVSRYERTVGRLRTRVFVALVAAVASAVAAVGGTNWWWCAVALSTWYGVTGYTRLRRTRPPQRSAYPTQWSPGGTTASYAVGKRRGIDVLGGLLGRSGLSRGAVGADVAERMAVAESNLTRVVPAVERLYPPAGAELARAVDEAAPQLDQQVERLAVLDGITREWPAARRATRPGRPRCRCGSGCGSASRRTRDCWRGRRAARRTGPGPQRDRALSPAVEGMKAYTPVSARRTAAATG